MFFLLNSLNAGRLSIKCHSQSGYSESGRILGSAPSLRIFAPTTVVELISLLRIYSFGASLAALPLEPFFALPLENVRWLTTPIASLVMAMPLIDLTWFIAINLTCVINVNEHRKEFFLYRKTGIYTRTLSILHEFTSFQVPPSPA